MEIKIASYQESNIRLQLIQIGEKDENQAKIGSKYFKNYHFQIRKNRKILYNFKREGPARQKFNALIQQELLQTKITYEK